MAVQTVRVNNQLIAYHEQGTGEPVLLLHPGFVADGMLPLLDRPALSGYWLVAPHRRGYGSSGPTQPPVGMADLAADVLGFLRSEERRVGKEWRSRGAACPSMKEEGSARELSADT